MYSVHIIHPYGLSIPLHSNKSSLKEFKKLISDALFLKYSSDILRLLRFLQTLKIFTVFILSKL